MWAPQPDVRIGSCWSHLLRKQCCYQSTCSWATCDPAQRPHCHRGTHAIIMSPWLVHVIANRSLLLVRGVLALDKCLVGLVKHPGLIVKFPQPKVPLMPFRMQLLFKNQQFLWFVLWRHGDWWASCSWDTILTSSSPYLLGLLPPILSLFTWEDEPFMLLGCCTKWFLYRSAVQLSSHLVLPHAIQNLSQVSEEVKLTRYLT